MTTPEHLTWDSLTESLLFEFPSLREEYERQHWGFKDWHPGQYVIFGSVFNKYIEATQSGPVGARSKIGSFLERMASSNVENIEDLLKIEVLPTLIESQAMIDAYWPQLGPRTQWFVDLIAPSKAPNIILRR
jgi:hypothetical protein